MGRLIHIIVRFYSIVVVVTSSVTRRTIKAKMDRPINRYGPIDRHRPFHSCTNLHNSIPRTIYGHNSIVIAKCRHFNDFCTHIQLHGLQPQAFCKGITKTKHAFTYLNKNKTWAISREANTTGFCCKSQMSLLYGCQTVLPSDGLNNCFMIISTKLPSV